MQENVTHRQEKSQSIQIDAKMTKMMVLADKGCKVAIVQSRGDKKV